MVAWKVAHSVGHSAELMAVQKVASWVVRLAGNLAAYWVGCWAAVKVVHLVVWRAQKSAEKRAGTRAAQ